MLTLDPLMEAERLLCCPDDGARVRLHEDALKCSACDREFRVFGNRVIEMLPREPVCPPHESVSERYRQNYLEGFNRSLFLGNIEPPWGDPEHADARWVAIRRRQAQEALALLLGAEDGNRKILCDISAGAGYCTLTFARYFRLVVHCDISVGSICYAWKRAREQGLDNLLFLRIDYFRPPFRGVIDRVMCLDTLIRGEEHERLLLKSIGRSLTSEGVAVVDFHHWWHNPIRRLGILPDNFKGNRSYTRYSLKCLFKSAGISQFEEARFVQEADLNSRMGRLVARLIPATRLMYRLPAWALTDTQSS